MSHERFKVFGCPRCKSLKISRFRPFCPYCGDIMTDLHRAFHTHSEASSYILELKKAETDEPDDED